MLSVCNKNNKNKNIFLLILNHNKPKGTLTIYYNDRWYMAEIFEGR